LQPSTRISDIQIHIAPPSRLHFGLTSIGDNELGRQFGGAGLMVETLSLVVSAYFQPSRKSFSWELHGGTDEDRQRLAEIIARFALRIQLPGGKLDLELTRRPPSHIGLGTGTQFAFACAEVMRIIATDDLFSLQQMIDVTGRGKRSGVGCHGYFQGGFLVDAGHAKLGTYPSLIGRYAFPDWPVVLIYFDEVSGLSGSAEVAAFEQLQASVHQQHSGYQQRSARMVSLLMQGIIPAVVEHDYDSFGPHLFEFNRLGGEWFASFQKGCYAHHLTETIFEAAKSLGISALGQSSWGPTLFAICRDTDQSESLVALLDREYSADVAWQVCRAENEGRLIEVERFEHTDGS
jgi:beta-RFAP synthase